MVIAPLGYTAENNFCLFSLISIRAADLAVLPAAVRRKTMVYFVQYTTACRKMQTK